MLLLEFAGHFDPPLVVRGGGCRETSVPIALVAALELSEYGLDIVGLSGPGVCCFLLGRTLEFGVWRRDMVGGQMRRCC